MTEIRTSRVRLWHALLLAVLMGVNEGTAAGQAESTSTIDSTGQATIHVAPEFIEFELLYSASGSNMESSTERALEFEEDLHQAFADLDLPGGIIRTSGLSAKASENSLAVLHARARFFFESASNPEARARFAAFVSDRVKKAERSLKFEMTGPLFGVIEREVFEQEAIARATENALYKSDAVASLMDASIVSVQSVSVIEVTWGEASPDEPGGGSDTQRVLCTAKVRVVYEFSLP